MIDPLTMTAQQAVLLDDVWIRAAKGLGMSIRRSHEVFASWDGRGTLTIGTPETLDPDDTLAQMILHETCHFLVEGPEAFGQPDWGIENGRPELRVREHACLRLQAALADTVGLREFFTATTVFRRYYRQLGESPLVCETDPAAELAMLAWQRSREAKYAEPLNTAMRETGHVLGAIAEELS